MFFKRAAVAGQFRQHYREPYDLRRLQRVGNRSRMHFPRAGRYPSAAIGAIDCGRKKQADTFQVA